MTANTLSRQSLSALALTVSTIVFTTNSARAQTGACCIFPGECIQVTLAECVANEGTFSGNTSICNDQQPCPSTGACCFATGCEIRTEQDCVNSGLNYQGDAVTCAQAACTIVNEGNGNGNDNENANDNTNSNGNNNENANGGPPQDSLGPCCITDATFGAICVEVTLSDCLDMNGVIGAGDSCETTTCAAGVSGAPVACCGLPGAGMLFCLGLICTRTARSRRTTKQP